MTKTSNSELLSLIQVLSSEDDLGVVVRVHLHIEQQLNLIIEGLVPHPKSLPRLRFEQKIKLAIALGLNQDFFEPLKKIGDIRNSFSHDIKAKLTRDLVIEFLAALTQAQLDKLNKAYEKTLAQLCDGRPFWENHHRQIFTLLSVFLYVEMENPIKHLKRVRK
ncbi:MAG: hypothetical protein ACAH10_02980 [Methylophilaceae bacterium]